MTARVIQLFPELTDVNGDAQNAAVLVQRARWAGLDVDLAVASAGDPLPTETPLAVVLGSGVDSALGRTREALRPLESTLRSWVDEGVYVLGVGTGFELLGDSIELPDGALDGLGLLTGVSRPLPTRAAGEIVLDADGGVLVGYENHARGFDATGAPDEQTAFGAVRHGIGDGQGTEGARRGRVWGTRLHGPLLARNPRLADEILALTGGDTSEQGERADFIAERSRAALLRKLG